MKHRKPYYLKSSKTSEKRKKLEVKKGHKPYFRSMPEDIDDIRYVLVTVCPGCGGQLLSESVHEVREEVYEDILIGHPVTVKLLIERRYYLTAGNTAWTEVKQRARR